MPFTFFFFLPYSSFLFPSFSFSAPTRSCRNEIQDTLSADIKKKKKKGFLLNHNLMNQVNISMILKWITYSVTKKPFTSFLRRNQVLPKRNARLFFLLNHNQLISVNIYNHTCAHIHTHIRIYIYTYAYIHVRTYTHTYTYYAYTYRWIVLILTDY